MNKYIEFELDKIRHFRLGMMAQKRIEDHFKKPFAKIDPEEMKAEDFSYMLWATMQQKERDEIKPSEFIEIIDEHSTLKGIYELYKDITEEAFGKNENPPETPQIPEEVDTEENGIGTKQYKTLSDAE